MIAQLEPRDLAAWLQDGARTPPLLVDVREPWEQAHCLIPGSVTMPLQTVPSRVAELPQDRDLVLVCHHGNRSQRAAEWLAQKGYARLHNLSGGVEAWSTDVDPAMPRY